jgi:hypothetical protein
MVCSSCIPDKRQRIHSGSIEVGEYDALLLSVWQIDAISSILFNVFMSEEVTRTTFIKRKESPRVD